MKRKKLAGVACLFLLLLLLLLLPQTNAQGEKTLEFKDYIPGGEEGENVSVTTDKAKGKLDIEFSFDNAGYHTVTAFQNDKQELKNEKGVRFFVENLSEVPARMNFAVINSEGSVYQVRDGRYVRLVPKDTSKEESFPLTENGCFELPTGFAGEVELSFELFANEFGAMDAKSAKELMGYGMVCVTEGETPFHLVCSQMAFVSKKHLRDVKEGAFLAIEGPDRIQRSNVGDSREKYRAVVYNMLGEGEEINAVFSPGESSPEITADEEGWVNIPAGIGLNSFSLEAVTSEGMNAEKEIQLTESWTRQVLTENGYDASIAPPSEIASVAGPAVYTEERILWFIRIGSASILAVLFAYYAYIRKQNRGRRRE